MIQKEPAVQSNSFKQFVFDNADFNVRTLDGYGTFHGMGGIMCVTPGSAVANTDAIKRIKERPTADTCGQLRKIEVQTYTSRNTKGIDGITVEAVDEIVNLSSPKAEYSLQDMLWMCGSWLKIPNNPSWSGYMALATEGSKTYQTSKVLILPFVNLQPSSLDAIYTVLAFAADKCEQEEQQTCVVTFDQPLYAKAVDMVAAESSDGKLSSVVIRLGGFHLLMSFMGAVGYIMGGSGLKELWSVIYAHDSVEKMLTGHAFARSLRAHFLTQLALAQIILREVEINEAAGKQLASLHETVMGNATSSDDLNNDPVLAAVLQSVQDVMHEAAATSRTAKLWIQYHHQITLMRRFIRAERCGNWALHLETVREMIPHFHAAGHLAYAKYAHLYLQQMSDLENKMTEDEFQEFSSSGSFTIRRSDKLWAGVWSDMTIDQVLMRAMKTSGGLTRGRGLTDSVLSRWVLSMPSCTELTRNFEEFCGIKFETSEQHVDLRKANRLRDNSDASKLTEWFTLHHPFPQSHELMSISTGVIGNETINCDAAVATGTASMNKLVGKTFGEVTLHRKDRVLPLAAVNSSVKIRQETVPINTMQLFSRIICVAKSDEDFASYLEFELALVPYHYSMRYPCGRLTRRSCITWSSHSADVCRAAAILRAAWLSWMEDTYCTG